MVPSRISPFFELILTIFQKREIVLAEINSNLPKYLLNLNGDLLKLKGACILTSPFRLELLFVYSSLEHLKLCEAQ